MAETQPLRGQPAQALSVAPLLTTKLYIPHGRAALVPRPRLSARLDAGLGGRLTLVSAPAGFGKTTLLAEWIRELAQRPGAPAVGWLSLDEGDSDPARFWSYTIAALQAARPEVGRAALALLHAPQPPQISTIVTTLINEVAGVPGRVVVVLDDYHLIDSPAVHDGLAFLLDHLPPQLHLVVAGRADLPLPLARLRARGQLAELRTEDLRFTPDEAAAFLHQVLGPELSPENAATLAARTEGWIAGLQLAVLSLQNRQDVDRFIDDFGGDDRHIVDYLVEEVLQRQPPEVQTFLVATSLLDRLCAPLCDAVTERDDGQAMLESLQAANLFIVALDSHKRWYRYHPLFADLLRHRLQRAAPERIPHLHLRASEWYAANGLPTKAVGHALAAGADERAAQLIEGLACTPLVYTEAATALGWLEALPRELVRSRPLLAIAYAWTLQSAGRFQALEAHLQQAEGALAESSAAEIDGCDLQGWLGHLDALRASLANSREEYAEAIALARRALERLPADDLMARSRVTLSLGHAFAYGREVDVTEAGRTFHEAIAISRTAGDAALTLTALINLARLHMRVGRLTQAAADLQQALQLAAEHGEGLLPLGRVHVVYGHLHWERNELQEAERQIRTGIRLGKQDGRVVDLVHAYVSLARVQQGQAQWPEASRSITRARMLAEGALEASSHSARQGRRTLGWLAALVAENQARLWLAQGNLEAAARWAEEKGLRPDDPEAPRRREEYATFARLLAARGQMEQALTLLAQLLGAATGMGEVRQAIQLRTQQALLLRAQGDTAQALAALQRALAAAAPEGYVRLFVDEGPAMAALLREWRGREARGVGAGAADHLAQRTLLAYVDRLLAAFGSDEPPVAAGSALPGGRAPLIEPLTEREQEVLRLMAAGLSNQEIAERLIVAIGTVKKHSHNIYGKLGVRSRTQALLRAQELELLPEQPKGASILEL